MNRLYLFDKGFEGVVAGVDEAGRGPLAGPVVAAAVIIKGGHELLTEVNDSKKLTAGKREKLYEIIIQNSFYGVGIVDNKRIDEINILNATFEAMNKALMQIEGYDIVLVDGNKKIKSYAGNQQTIVKGDSLSLSIAAASIIAKVTRDRIMEKYAAEYPKYGFEKHMGYGTEQHRKMVVEHGMCEIHRKTFLRNIMAPRLF